jgi:predicted ABC-type ATPase
MANLPDAIRFADQSVVYDNSSVSHTKLVEISDGKIAFNRLDKTTLAHCEVASAIGSALDIAPNEVFETARYT